MSRRDHLFLAFVLHRRDYSNTSLLLEIFASGQGRFPAIAKGARRPRNPASALLQPFQPLWLSAVGRGEVRTLARVEPAGRPLQLQGRRLLAGFYLNELLIRLLGRHDPHDALFLFYQSALVGLGADGDLETLLRGFELRLLDELGYALTLDREAHSGAPVRPEHLYRVEPDLGVCRAGVGEQGQTLSGATLLALARGGALDPAQRREARLLLRAVLDAHLGGRPLASRELYRRWYGDQAPSATSSPP